MRYAVCSRNGPEQLVAYPEGDYLTREAAECAAQDLRKHHPFESEEVQQGWYSTIEVVEIMGMVSGPCLSHF